MLEEGSTASFDWTEFYRYTDGRELRPLFAKGMAAVAAAGLEPGHAIDIGFGDGQESLALLRDGWQVTAIDPTPAAADLLREKVPPTLRGRLATVTSSAEAADLPPFDLLYAGYALPFIAPAAFQAFWATVRARLQPGGMLVVNVFGDRDAWFGDPDMTFLDRQAAERLVDGLDIVAFDEEDAIGTSLAGPKHWHVFDLIARRPFEDAR